MKNTEQEKVFVIINSYFIGDIILTGSLIQNIKKLYKNSKVVMLSSPKLEEVAQYLDGVDETIIWDRHGEHKGFIGMFKFIKNFPYKKIFASFPIYGMDRPVLLGYLLGSKYNLFRNKKNIFKHLLKSKYKISKIEKNDLTTQIQHLRLLEGITKEELIDCKIKYNLDKNIPSVLNTNIENYVVLCPVSSRPSKDMYKEVVKEIIEKINSKVVLLGHGKVSEALSEYLKEFNLSNLIDLTNQTSIQQAGQIINNSTGVISVDTGLMHISCALDKPTTCVFYEVHTSPYMPDENLYKAKVIHENQTAENILNTFKNLLNKEQI